MTLLRKYGLLVLGVVLTVVGAVVMLTQPIQFGCVAYAPFDGAVFVPPWSTPGFVAEGVFLILGLVATEAYCALWACRVRSVR